MKFSIITVNLNNRNGLKKTIDSVISQTFTDFEWIVIDGGSTDGSKELLEEYSSYFSYWVSEPDKGIYNAMNKGVTEANGEYLQFLNSGDSFSSSSVLNEVCCLIDNEDVIYGDTYLISNDNATYKIVKGSDNITLFYMLKGTICHQSAFIKRELLVKSPYNEELKLVSDWEFFVKMIISGKIFKHINIVICNYETNGISTDIRLLDKERSLVIDKIFPTELADEHHRIRQLESYLANTRIEDFIQLRKKHPIIGKFLTALILFMKTKR